MSKRTDTSSAFLLFVSRVNSSYFKAAARCAEEIKLTFRINKHVWEDCNKTLILDSRNETRTDHGWTLGRGNVAGSEVGTRRWTVIEQEAEKAEGYRDRSKGNDTTKTRKSQRPLTGIKPRHGRLHGTYLKVYIFFVPSALYFSLHGGWFNSFPERKNCQALQTGYCSPRCPLPESILVSSHNLFSYSHCHRLGLCLLYPAVLNIKYLL